MIESDAFLSAARQRGLDFYAGVPCSFLTPLINGAIAGRHGRYVGATSEGEAVGIAAGAWAAGRGAVVMCQNSGLGNMVNPLTSLCWPFRIPMLMVVTWRGEPGLADEPQHELMGDITHGMLAMMRVPHRPFPSSGDTIADALDAARQTLDRSNLPFAFVMEQGSVRDEELPHQLATPPSSGNIRRDVKGGSRPTRAAVLERLLATVPDRAAIIATTGKCGRELFTLADRPQHLYQVGSMGCASAFGLGVALNADRPIVVLDGDGAALMKLGNMATIGAQHPHNLVHIILDNGVHDSTGGQMTVSGTCDFSAMATACGYAEAIEVDDLSSFVSALERALTQPGPNLIHARIAAGSMSKLGRPTIAPKDVMARFRAFLSDPGPMARTVEAGR